MLGLFFVSALSVISYGAPLTTTVTASEAISFIETHAWHQAPGVANMKDLKAALKSCEKDLGGEVRTRYDWMDARPQTKLPSSCLMEDFGVVAGYASVAIIEVRTQKLIGQFEPSGSFQWSEILKLWKAGDFSNYDNGITIPRIYAGTPDKDQLIEDLGYILELPGVIEGETAIDNFFKSHEGPRNLSFHPLKDYLKNHAGDFKKIAYVYFTGEWSRNALVLIDSRNQSLALYMGYSK